MYSLISITKKELVLPRPDFILAEPSGSNNSSLKNGTPKGIRTPVTAVKGRCPRPLDDGSTKTLVFFSLYYKKRDGTPKGIRTPVTAVKGRCPRPLDDGSTKTLYSLVSITKKEMVLPRGFEPLLPP